MISSPKVVHLTSVHPPEDTRIYWKECRTLARAGYRVVLVAPTTEADDRNGVRVRAVPKARGRLERVTRTAAAVVRAALDEDADLYHFHDPELLPWAQLLRIRGKRVVFDMHENIPAVVASRVWINPLFRPLARFAYERVERTLLRGIPVVFAEESYRRRYPWVREQTTVLNLPSLDSFPGPVSKGQGPPRLVYLGAVSSSRGSAVCTAALELLRSEGHDVRWECIGSIPNPGDALELHAAADRLGENVITLRGRTSHPDALKIAANCEIGLAVLQELPNYTDSYPTKLFEYMALGLPVIASRFPLYRSVVEESDCGICVDPGNPREVAAAVRRLIDHPREAREMGKRGRRAVLERYNWDTQGEKLLSFYSRLLTGGERESEIHSFTTTKS